MPRSIVLVALALALITRPAAAAEPEPFDEQTLDRIQELNQAISDHYEDLQVAAVDIEARREITASRLQTIQEEIDRLESERLQVPRNTDGRAELKALEENRLEAKSRYLEALAEQHAIDVESTTAFEEHATGILVNLERLASELETSQGLSGKGDTETAAKGLYTLQRGTAIALSVLEQWDVLQRDDPRFRALWATARVLNRNVESLRSGTWSDGIAQTVSLVKERIFVVRSLVDQARALQPALDQKGLLLQIAAQNQMLQLYSTNLGLIDGLELPDLEIDESIQQIIADIEQEPQTSSARRSRDPLEGFDDCAQRGLCE